MFALILLLAVCVISYYAYQAYVFRKSFSYCNANDVITIEKPYDLWTCIDYPNGAFSCINAPNGELDFIHYSNGDEVWFRYENNKPVVCRIQTYDGKIWEERV